MGSTTLNYPNEMTHTFEDLIQDLTAYTKLKFISIELDHLNHTQAKQLGLALDGKKLTRLSLSIQNDENEAGLTLLEALKTSIETFQLEITYKHVAIKVMEPLWKEEIAQFIKGSRQESLETATPEELEVGMFELTLQEQCDLQETGAAAIRKLSQLSTQASNGLAGALSAISQAPAYLPSMSSLDPRGLFGKCMHTMPDDCFILPNFEAQSSPAKKGLRLTSF